MTGEMGWSDLKDYPDILALAKRIQTGAKVAAEVRPFDVYQGPYIAVDLDCAPLRGTRPNRIGSWNLSVWYGELRGTWVIDYRHRREVVSSGTEAIRVIKTYKTKRK
jgi:hypothetical protein